MSIAQRMGRRMAAARVGVVTRATIGVPINPTPPPNPPFEIPTRSIAGITTTKNSGSEISKQRPPELSRP